MYNLDEEEQLSEVGDLESVQDVDENNPEIAKAVGYLKAKIQSKERTIEHLYKQPVHAQSFADVYDLLVHNLKISFLKFSIQRMQRSIQKLDGPIYEGLQSDLDHVLSQQRTERQVEMTNAMIDSVLDHWILTPIQFLLPNILKNDISKLIVGVTSMFGSNDTESYQVEDEIRNNHLP